MNELESWLILSRAKGVGTITALKALQKFGTPYEIINASNSLREKSGVFKQPALDYFSKQDFSNIEPDLALLKEDKVSILNLNDDKYPKILKEITDPPIILFVRGDVDLLNQPQLGIVGSRNPDTLGKEITQKFAKKLSASGITITSGMALGIDKYAHLGALKGIAGTIAVLGTGIDRVYPASHKDLAHDIVKNGGILLSEFGANTQPRPQNFPIRNRIISGLSLGVLVVQAKIKSGSLITARMAMEQGREVFAIPGSINNPLAKGCHHLIKQGVKLVETAEDIFEELSGILGYIRKNNNKSSLKSDKSPQNSSSDLPNQLNNEFKIYRFIEYDALSINYLANISKLPIEQINSELTQLELLGKITILSGAKVQRI